MSQVKFRYSNHIVVKIKVNAHACPNKTKALNFDKYHLWYTVLQETKMSGNVKWQVTLIRARPTPKYFNAYSQCIYEYFNTTKIKYFQEFLNLWGMEYTMNHHGNIQNHK